MSLLFFDAFQDFLAVPKPEWGLGGATVTVGTGRDGTNNGAVTGTSFSVTPAVLAIPGQSGQTLIVGYAQLGQNQDHYVQIGDSVGGAQLAFCVNTSGLIDVRRNTRSGTIIGTSSGHAPIGTTTWAHIAFKVVSASGATGSVVVQLNGVTVLTLSSIVTSSNGNAFNRLWLNVYYSGSSTYFDDMYIMDGVDETATVGYPNNDFIGDVKVTVSVPTAAGDSTQWTPSTGANYAAVDEIPPNTTDYVSDSVSGHRDLYNITDLPSSPPVTRVYAIREGLYASKSDAGAMTIKPTIKESVSGTVTNDSAQGLSTSYAAVWGSMKKTKAAGTTWSTTDVNGLQAGVEVA